MMVISLLLGHYDGHVTSLGHDDDHITALGHDDDHITASRP